MKEQVIAKTYAQAIRSISKDEGFDAVAELVKFNSAVNVSTDLEQVLFLEAFSEEEKTGVLEDLSKKLGIHQTVQNFMKYLVNEKRMSLINMIYKEVVIMDDDEKGFLKGSIQGATDSIDEETKKKIIEHLEKKLNKKVNLSYEKNEKITAGYRVSAGDYLMDASLDNQFDEFKKTIMF